MLGFLEMKDNLQHRGYDGSVEFSAENKMLHGRVLGIEDMISFGGTSVRTRSRRTSGTPSMTISPFAKTWQNPQHPLQRQL